MIYMIHSFYNLTMIRRFQIYYEAYASVTEIFHSMNSLILPVFLTKVDAIPSTL